MKLEKFIKMNISKFFFILFTLFTSVHSFGQKQDLNTVAKWLEGSFSSEMQSKEDTSYFNIHLQITPIWTSRTDGKWLYVEQAMSTMLNKPYRQRIYHITSSENGKVESAIYTLEDPLRFAQQPDLVNQLSLDSIKLKVGCSVYLNWDEKKNLYSGGTLEKGCPSDRKGASYTTSEVNLFEDKMISWDRGYNSKDEQVWGAEKGGYIFIKEKKK